MVIAFLCLPATKICCNINLTMDIVSVKALLLKVFILFLHLYNIHLSVFLGNYTIKGLKKINQVVR